MDVNLFVMALCLIFTSPCTFPCIFLCERTIFSETLGMTYILAPYVPSSYATAHYFHRICSMHFFKNLIAYQ